MQLQMKTKNLLELSKKASDLLQILNKGDLSENQIKIFHKLKKFSQLFVNQKLIYMKFLNI